MELFGILLGLLGFAFFIALFGGEYQRLLKKGKTRTYAMTRVAIMVLMLLIAAGLLMYTTIGRKLLVWFLWNNPVLPLSSALGARSLGIYPAEIDAWPTISQITDWLLWPTVCLVAIVCAWIAFDNRVKRSKE